MIEALEAHMTMLRGTLKRKKKKKKKNIVEDRVKPRAASMAIDVSRHWAGRGNITDIFL